MQVNIPNKLYFKIGEVCKIADVEPYVLRYWESEFKIIKPQKSKTNQRIYKRRDIGLILEIKRLLYNEKYTLEGAKVKVKEWQKHADNMQLNIKFPDQRYIKTLQGIKEELSSIKKILS